MKGVPDKVSDSEAEKVKSNIEPILKELEEALNEATQVLEKTSKGEDKRWIVARGCGDNCLVGKSNMIVAQVAGTLKGVVKRLGAGESSSIHQ
jgi:hypothetical protein